MNQYFKYRGRDGGYMKKSLITGVTGQDGSFLSEFLLEKGYDVHGMIRRSSVDYRERIAHLEGHKQFHLHYGDLCDTMSLVKVIGAVRPDEIYNLAAQSHVQVSFDVPEFTADVDATGVLRVLEAVRVCGLADTCRIYQASTSELYGKVEEVPQNENTPFHPYSPYAVAKQYGFWITKEYREAYNMFCCSGILFNHESERRGETFVTRKITLAAARIVQGKQDKLYIGNLSSPGLGLCKRLRGMYVADPAAGYTRRLCDCYGGAAHSPRVCHSCISLCGYRTGMDRGRDGRESRGPCYGKGSGRSVARFLSSDGCGEPVGRSGKAKRELGWNPTKTSFEELVRIMVEHDMKKVKAETAMWGVDQ